MAGLVRRGDAPSRYSSTRWTPIAELRTHPWPLLRSRRPALSQPRETRGCTAQHDWIVGATSCPRFTFRSLSPGHSNTPSGASWVSLRAARALSPGLRPRSSSSRCSRICASAGAPYSRTYYPPVSWPALPTIVRSSANSRSDGRFDRGDGPHDSWLSQRSCPGIQRREQHRPRVRTALERARRYRPRSGSSSSASTRRPIAPSRRSSSCAPTTRASRCSASRVASASRWQRWPAWRPPSGTLSW